MRFIFNGDEFDEQSFWPRWTRWFLHKSLKMLNSWFIFVWKTLLKIQITEYGKYFKWEKFTTVVSNVAVLLIGMHGLGLRENASIDISILSTIVSSSYSRHPYWTIGLRIFRCLSTSLSWSHTASKASPKTSCSMNGNSGSASQSEIFPFKS